MKKPYIDTYITNLINKRGYEDAPDAVKKQISDDLKTKLDEFIIRKILTQFSDAETAEFEKLLDEGKSIEELRGYASDHIPDYQTFMTSTLLLFQEAYLS
jgi:uncharacterized protein DUF5663